MIIDFCIRLADKEIQLGSCTFQEPRTGVLALAPNGPQGLAMLLVGSSVDGLADVVSLATPTIPPMSRSPVSCMSIHQLHVFLHSFYIAEADILIRTLVSLPRSILV